MKAGVTVRQYDPPCCPGTVLSLPEEECAALVRTVVETLVEAYGLPRHNNPEDPLDDLVFLVLSNRTPPARAQRIYDELKARYPRWDALLSVDVAEVAALLKPAGFGTKRATQLQGVVERRMADFGTTDVQPHFEWLATDELIAYLKLLPGVSDKVARCVAAYTLEREVLAVDVHVHRVACRLGWTTKPRPEQAHKELEGLVPPDLRHAFHVTAIAHGRKQCIPRMPLCQLCPIKVLCPFGQVLEQSVQQ